MQKVCFGFGIEKFSCFFVEVDAQRGFTQKLIVVLVHIRHLPGSRVL
jgi:hypothetical protein